MDRPVRAPRLTRPACRTCEGLPAQRWNVPRSGEPVPVCPAHADDTSVSWEEGCRLFLVAKVLSS